MTSKRWIAIGIALGLFLLWMLVPSANEEVSVDELLGTNGITEEVVSQRGEEKIALLEIDGTIAASSGDSLFASAGYNHQFFMAQLDEIANDELVKGILLEVNSPGGGVYESAEIARAIKAIQEDREIPFYVSMKNMAASGGYYVSASADKIYAADETMTGSIGVIMSGLNMSGLMDKLGISDETVKSGELKDVGSTTRKWTEKDRQVLQEMIDSSYGRFVDIVAEGRHMPEEKVREIADGRIYDGVQAKENGLVDELGFPEDAMAALQSENRLKNASIIQYQLPRSFADTFASSWLGTRVNGLLGQKNTQADALSKVLNSFSSEEAPRMMYLYGGE
ncbi:signal peptide peptidase SppA [Vagococcus sp. BWB3-3]|uniref:Signal peptide peptidase SppA n=1 Tax=Vagococcus allomyrinae TaxID=2794353 RepID=A0A940SV52_9ENTE|nr:signal peptide peptidase SppA [Vagococcus allomyrinae]MBP1041489.1 signal peptide peptidase SppA [Vagococcus allomyrinae]